MHKRVLSVFLALGLVIAAFAGTLTVGSAEEHENNEVFGPNQIYFPWVPNGSVIDDPREFGPTGPYYGTVTVQNLEGGQIGVDWDVTGTGDSGTFTLDAFESTTVTAGDLFDDDDVAGSGVIFTGQDGARIAAVQKQAAPVSPTGDARTGDSHEIVAGYTGLTADEIGQDLVLPIVQTNNNWNTLIRLTNFGATAATVGMTLHPAGGGDSLNFNLLVGGGQTETFDLLAEGVPDGWTGSARITSDLDVAAAAERVKNETNMLIMNTSQPVAEASSTQYAPLVFQEWFNWNTGISVANLAGNTNDITITYYADDGTQVDQETFPVPPNGMSFVYTPATVLNGNGEVDGFVGSAVIQGTYPFRAAVDEVKYVGDLPDVNHAMSYMVEDDVIGLNEALTLPLVQKGDDETAFGDTTGIQLFNPSGATASVAIWFLDQDGEEVLAIPQVVTLGPNEGHTAYTFDYDELPVDFQGSAIIRVIGGDGQVTAVSNNVNYEVQFDGSASFNLIRAGEVGPATPDVPFPPPASFTVEPQEATNVVGTEHEITVSVSDEGGVDVNGAAVAGVILSGPHAGTTLLETTGADDNPDGVATLSYTGEAVGTDQIMIHVQGITEVQYATKEWTAASPSVSVDASDLDGAAENEAGDIVATAANPSEAAGGVDEGQVRFRIILEGPEACDTEDWADWFEVVNINDADPADPQNINTTFTCEEGSFVGYWGPEAGFPLPVDYQASTTFNVQVNGAPAGDYTVTTQLFNVDTNEVLADDSDGFSIVDGD